MINQNLNNHLYLVELRLPTGLKTLYKQMAPILFLYNTEYVYIKQFRLFKLMLTLLLSDVVKQVYHNSHRERCHWMRHRRQLLYNLVFFFSCVPSYISGVHHFGWDFCVCDFSNHTFEVVTFCLRRWCMLGVILLPAFTRLGHKCKDVSSLCDGMHVCTD